MARDHARMKVATWESDADYLALTVTEQHAYQMLVQHSRLSWVGTMPYAPAKLAERAADLTPAKVRAAIRGLTAARFVVVDEDAHEILVRSYVRHDGTLDRANMGKAVAFALEQVMSDAIRDRILDELARYYVEQPDKAGWVGFRSGSPKSFDIVQAKASRMR